MASMDRKRASEDAPAVASEAKRVHLDGDEAAPEYALLEVRGLLTQQFRKEAIYRQLREARRDAQRAHDTAHTLEARVAQLQESVQCVNQFWDTLREVLRALHVDEHVLGAALQSALVQSAPLALEQSAAEHARGLQVRADVVRDVLACLTAHAPASAAAPDAVQDAQARQAQLAAESSTLRAALAAAHAQLSAAQADAARVTEALRAAQKAADRRESASVRAVEDPLGKARADAEAAQIAAANAERAEAERRKDTADAASADGGAPNAALEEELVTQRELAAARLEELGELRAEVGALQQQLAGVSAQLASLPDERVAAHPLFHQAQADMVLLQHEAERLRAECAAVVHENEQLREFRVEFQHQTATQANTHCDELQKQLRARDADIVRLRGQRDELNAELLERRARDTIKFAQVDELKALVAPKDERIEALRAQVHRLGVVLGVLRGETGAHGAADGVADADADVARATADGAALRAAAAADAADATPDALRHALTQVRAELEAANASTASLYDEVDRLSAAYDALDKQANAKLVNLAKLEDKIVRLTTEKSKADNKYFAAMRAKDAVEAELRTLARSTERQGKVIERYTDTEKGLQQQLMQAEKETSALRRAVQTHATKLAEAERDRSVLKRRAAELERGKAAAESSGAAHLASLNDERGARTRAEERAAILDKEVSRLKRRVADRDAGGAVRKRGAGDENTHLAYLDSLLKCSACKERYRDRIITKCLHTFCEACVNARIQTRQRKCPHCGLSFAISDVQVLYCTSAPLTQCNDVFLRNLRRELVEQVDEARRHVADEHRADRGALPQTVHGGHRARLRGLRARVRHGLLEVRDKLVDHRHGEPRARQVHRRRVAGDRVEVPTALAHLVAHVVHVDRARAADRKRAHERVPQNGQLGDLVADAALDRLGCADDLLARLRVSVLPHRHHHRPRRSDQRAGPRAGERRRGVHTADPRGVHVVLVAAQLLAVIHDDRRALRREAVLVRVARDRRDTLDTEVKRLRDEPGPLQERHEERAEAAVDVALDAVPLRQRTERHNVVNHPVGEVGRTAHQQHRVAVDRTAHRVDLHLARDTVDRHAAHLDAKVVARLVERDVRAHRHDHLGLGDAALGVRPVARRLARHQNRLGATRGGRARSARRRVVHVEHHRNHLGLHLAHPGEHVGVQRVRQQEAPQRIDDHAAQLVAAVVHGARAAAVAPVPLRVVSLLPEVLQHVQLLVNPALVAPMHRQHPHRRHRRRQNEVLLELARSRRHLALDTAPVRGELEQQPHHGARYGEVGVVRNATHPLGPHRAHPTPRKVQHNIQKSKRARYRISSWLTHTPWSYVTTWRTQPARASWAVIVHGQPKG